VYPAPIKDPNKFVKIRAKWDTGANHTVISVNLKDRLNLTPIDSEVLSGVGGSMVIDVVRLAIKLPNGLFISSKHIGVCNIKSAQGIDILIGMDIIQLGDFHISNAGDKSLFSFVIPSLPVPFSLSASLARLNGVGREGITKLKQVLPPAFEMWKSPSWMMSIPMRMSMPWAELMLQTPMCLLDMNKSLGSFIASLTTSMTKLPPTPDNTSESIGIRFNRSLRLTEITV
jgi:hypothetical protein